MSSNRLRDLMSLHNVPRWNSGLPFWCRQTVAEHSFNVSLIALQIAEAFGRYPPSLYYMIIRWGLMHDGPEAFTGDVNHLFKMTMDRGKIQEVEYRECPWYREEVDSVIDLVRAIVKIADKIDEVWCLDNYGVKCDDISAARDRALDQIVKHTWGAVRKFNLPELPHFVRYVMTGLDLPILPVNLWPVDGTPLRSPQDPQAPPTPPGTV